MKRYTITLTNELHEWLSNEAKVRGIPMNSICILALENYKDSKIPYNIPADLLTEIIDRVNNVRSNDLDD